MKSKLISISLCMVLAFVLGACGNQVKVSKDMTPTETVEAFLDSFKAQEWDNMDEIYAGKSDDFRSAYGFMSQGDDTDEVADLMVTKMLEFDYEVTNEQIAEDGKTASVDISTKAYNMTEVFNNFYQEYMDQALDTYSGDTSNMDEDALEELAMKILTEQINSAEKNYEGEATITLTKAADQWIVDEMDESNSDFLNAISGGMMDVAQDVINAHEEYGTGSVDADDAGDSDD